jgi:hypothetical protein
VEFPSLTLQDHFVVPVQAMLLETIWDAGETGGIMSGWIDIVESKSPYTRMGARI